MSITNDEFEDAGVNPGEADGWAAGIDIGRLEAPPIGALDGWPAIERFEADWDNDDWSDELEGTFAAPTEDFEAGWSNENWSEDFIASEQATLGGTEAPDGFEVLWDNDDWSDTLVGTEAKEFDVVTKPFEDFEEDWENNDWSDTLTGTEAMLFDSGTPVPYEDFEEEWPELVMQTV